MSDAEAYGPLSREEFQQLVDAPHGEATDRIRKFDPMWGRTAGEKIKWKVTFTRDVVEEGFVFVEAETEEEAEELADKINDRDIDWDFRNVDTISQIESVEPLAGKHSR